MELKDYKFSLEFIAVNDRCPIWNQGVDQPNYQKASHCNIMISVICRGCLSDRPPACPLKDKKRIIK